MEEGDVHLGFNSKERDDRRVKAFSFITAAICVVYFLALDRTFFSSRQFSPIFRYLLEYDRDTSVVLLAIICIATFPSGPRRVLRLVEFLGQRPIIFATGATIAFSLGSIFVYCSYPFSMDEYAAEFQAKIFASGHTYAQLPKQYFDWLIVRGFNNEFLVGSRETGRIIEAYWPGYAAILALFEYGKAPWLCNAALSALSLLLIHRITLTVTRDRAAAGWALLFAVGSGVFAAYAISYYSMQAHLTLNLLFAYFLIAPTRVRAFAAGIIGSLALILHNPMPHAVFALPWIAAVWINQHRWKLVPSLILGYLPGFAIFLGWLVVRSHIGEPIGIQGAMAASMREAFAWPNLTTLNIRAASLVKMLVWSAPCLFVFAAIGFAENRAKLPIRLLGWSVMFTFAAYLFVTFDQGHGWGYRYFQPVWGSIPVFAGCALSSAAHRSSKTRSFAGGAVLLGLLIVVPLQLFQIHQAISKHLAQIAPPRRPGNNVYFVHPQFGFYVADMVQIDPLLRQKDLVLVSRGAPLDEKMIGANWPDAVKVASAPSYDQWYLGSTDVRTPTSNDYSAGEFTLK